MENSPEDQFTTENQLFAAQRQIEDLQEDLNATEQALSEVKAERDDLMQAIKELNELAERDPLTGLYNRRGFFNSVEPIFEAVKSNLSRPQERRSHEATALSVIVIDLDGLKIVNDNHGHAAGDELIKKAAEVIRHTDVEARFGGDEFVIALKNTNRLELAAVVHKLKTIMQEVGVEGSLGTASLDHDSEAIGQMSLEQLIADADADMYADKAIRKP